MRLSLTFCGTDVHGKPQAFRKGSGQAAYWISVGIAIHVWTTRLFGVLAAALQSVRRPLLRFTYGSTNKYRPVNMSKKSGGSGVKLTQMGGLSCVVKTMVVMMTATMKTIDSQRCVCLIKLFQFNATSFEIEACTHVVL